MRSDLGKRWYTYVELFHGTFSTSATDRSTSGYDSLFLFGIVEIDARLLRLECFSLRRTGSPTLSISNYCVCNEHCMCKKRLTIAGKKGKQSPNEHSRQVNDKISASWAVGEGGYCTAWPQR